MANLFDYLSWRGDIPFSVDPFNEVDNLILSSVAYTDFRGIVPENEEEISLQDACTAYFARHERTALSDARSFTDKVPLLMDGMISGSRFRDIRLCRYVDDTNSDSEMQLSAITFLLPTGEAYIAFRGTDSSVIGWKEDFNFCFLSATEGQTRAVEYLNSAGRSLQAPLIIGGHSKGGNFAVYASAFCDPDIQERILKIYTNDGPGFRQEVALKEGISRILPRIVRIIPDTSIIGTLLYSKAVPHVIKSCANGILQHDGFSWEVKRNRFVRTERSDAGALIEEALRDWLEQMDDETRKSFIDTIFLLIESTGKESFSSIGGDKWNSVESIIAAARSMPKERMQQLQQLFRQLRQTSGQTAFGYISERLEEFKNNVGQVSEHEHAHVG